MPTTQSALLTVADGRGASYFDVPPSQQFEGLAAQLEAVQAQLAALQSSEAAHQAEVRSELQHKTQEAAELRAELGRVQERLTEAERGPIAPSPPLSSSPCHDLSN